MRRLEPAGGPMRGRLAVPGDKSISHRVALLGALAGAPCRARGWLDAQDTRRSLDAIVALGARAQVRDGTLTVEAGGFPAAWGAPGTGGAAGGPGAAGVPSGPSAPGAPSAGAPPEVTLDCGNSGTTARLLLGLLAGRRVTAVLDGDASLRARPMDRVAAPLEALGAGVTWLGEHGRLPLRLEGHRLTGGSVRLPVVSAQVKSALLLAGLAAGAPVTVTGCGATRDHTERLLRLMGAEPAAEALGDALCVEPLAGRALAPFDVEVPGDPSSAAFLLAAALLVPGSEVTVENALLNPTRSGFLRVIERMGAKVDVRFGGRAGGAPRATPWEPVGQVTVRHGPLRPFTIAPAEVPSLIDELPILAVVATQAAGVSTVAGAAELRVKESDRIAAIAAGLRAFGVEMEERPDGFAVRGLAGAGGSAARPGAAGAAAAPGSPRLRAPAPGQALRAAGDHRVAMALAVAALAADGPAALDDDACVAISYPDFFAALAKLAPGA